VYKGKKIGIVVPAYNEESLISKTIKSVPDFVDKVYVVDDASTDRTAEIARSFSNSRIMCTSHLYNRGAGAAVVSGYKQALADNVDIVVVMAGDNQMDPAHMTKLIEPVIRGTADYAKGDRLSNKHHQLGMSKWRRFGNWLLTWLTRIVVSNWRISDPQNGYTAISQETLKKIDLDGIYPSYGYCNDLLVKLTTYGYRIADVPMPARYGQEKSKIKYSKYIPKVSILLLRDFLWRLKVKYLKGN